MKKSKIILSVVLALVLVCTALVAVACHKHEFGGEWFADETSHWQKATCEHTEEIGNKAPHTFKDGRCTVCGYTQDLSSLLPYADNTVLRIAAGYNNGDTGITFSASKAGSGVKLSDGTTYNEGDLKPTWKQISEDMKIKFENKYSGKSAANEYDYWVNANNTSQVDIMSGTATKLQEGGAQGLFVNLVDYLDKMPNFRQYLEDNPIVRLSVTGSVTGENKGAIYFSPYFDGVDDIERFPLVRSDFVRTLLDGTEEYHGDNRAVTVGKYLPYMPKEGSVVVESLTADGKGTQNITKDYSKYGNIIDKMNSETNLTGDKAVAMFREYIDKTYGDTYAKRSDLFLGYDAAWDADELVALLRCAVASLHDSTSERNPISGLYSRETENTQREVDLFRFAGSLFGVRGMESRQDYLYFDKDGKLHDARQETDAYEAVLRLNALKEEGLVAVEGSVNSQNRLARDAGIVSYDYSQTQTIYNDTELNGGKNAVDKTQTDEEYTPMMVPVAYWNDGTGAKYFRFTESWRSVKTEGWAISKAGVGTDTNKLNAALALIDFAFSAQGQITMSYGSDDFIKVKNADAVVNIMSDIPNKYETFNFNGQEWPVISEGCANDLATLASGNYTNFARFYLGSTLNGFPKSQAFEYQCTHKVGKEGAGKVSAAIGLGTVKHPVLSVNTENMWYTSVPTTLPHTTTENAAISGYSELGNSKWSSSSGQNINVFIEIIKLGWSNTAITATNAETAVNVVKTDWHGTQYLQYKQAAWDRLLEFYNGLSK